jgi:hypothetical protein
VTVLKIGTLAVEGNVSGFEAFPHLKEVIIVMGDLNMEKLAAKSVELDRQACRRD